MWFFEIYIGKNTEHSVFGVQVTGFLGYTPNIGFISMGYKILEFIPFYIFGYGHTETCIEDLQSRVFLNRRPSFRVNSIIVVSK